MEFTPPSSQKKKRGRLRREEIGESKEMKWGEKGEEKRGKGKGWPETPNNDSLAAFPWL